MNYSKGLMQDEVKMWHVWKTKEQTNTFGNWYTDEISDTGDGYI